MAPNIKVSVVIPAYNAEKYISQSLNSVLHQTMSSDQYEVIVVDDGSTDTTAEIVKSYAQKHKNLQFVSIPPLGVSVARNEGLKQANGEYLYFFDADDILEETALNSLYNKACEKNADIVIAKYDMFNQLKTTPIHNLDGLMLTDTPHKLRLEILKTFTLWNKLFKRSIISENNITFPPVSYSEDGVFLFNFLLYAENVACLDKVIIHYRRYDKPNSSLATAITENAVRDYIKAHDIMLEFIYRIFDKTKDNPKYKTIADTLNGANIPLERYKHIYINQFIKKELTIIFNRFLSSAWRLSTELYELIYTEINNKLSMLDLKTRLELEKELANFSVNNLEKDHQEIAKHAKITFALYSTKQNIEDFFNCLDVLKNQNFLYLRIVLPEAMKECVLNENAQRDNISYVDAPSPHLFYQKVCANTQTEFIVFCSPCICYTTVFAGNIIKKFISSQADFMTLTVNHRDFHTLEPLLSSTIFARQIKKGLPSKKLVSLDCTLENKVFRTDFIKRHISNLSANKLSFANLIYKKGYYSYLDSAMVYYTKNRESYFDYVGEVTAKQYIEELHAKKIDNLKDTSLNYDPLTSYKKLVPLEGVTPPPDDIMCSAKMQDYIKQYSTKPIVDRVLFISSHTDTRLNDNLNALYPLIKSEKIILTQVQPKSIKDTKKIAELIFTSRIIVTDSKLDFLRYYPLRPSQRVIQLWFTSGAFKKFGIRGTTLPIREEKTFYAQYSLVTVGSEYMRDIYADAFDIDIHKVQPLGIMQTDIYFDKAKLLKKRLAIYKKHPELIFKSVIVYAPTARSFDDDYMLNIDLDFDKLSQELRFNQLLLICPHPSIKNDLLNREYKNIRVMQDLPTRDYMLISDMLITDYSSLIFEYVLLNRPIAFYGYDLSSHINKLYFNYTDDLPNTVFKTQRELTEYIKTKHKRTNYSDFKNKYLSACDGKSCKRVAQLINSYLGKE